MPDMAFGDLLFLALKQENKSEQKLPKLNYTRRYSHFYNKHPLTNNLASSYPKG